MRAALLAAMLLCAAPAAAQGLPGAAEDEEALPAGEGRSETFGYCTACHSTAIIRRSGFTRAQWDGLMDWMSEKHGMAELEGELRTQIVDYLARAFPPRQGRRAANPFLD